MKRRTLLQLLLSVVAALPARIRLFAQAPALTPGDEARIRALADIVLPGELGAEGKTEVVAGFGRWLRDYREGVDTDHGYGFTRLRRTAASPVRRYAAQLDALDARGGDRRAAVEAAIAEAKIERLPSRPDGGHVATDLMSFYFNSAGATDRAYGAAIQRDACRGLAGSENRPAPIQTGGR
jgi:hypothetical protein